jgi:hypothetical protein
MPNPVTRKSPRQFLVWRDKTATADIDHLSSLLFFQRIISQRPSSTMADDPCRLRQEQDPDFQSASTVWTTDGESRERPRFKPQHRATTMEEPSPSLLPSPNPLDSLLSDRVHHVWQPYRSLVKKHRVKLELADDVVDRLLFWVPYHENKQAWREVVYGLLSLNRLAMDCATQDESSSIDNSYGTTLLVPKRPSIPATSLRIALTITHCLMPSILEMVSSSNSTVSSSRRRQQTTRARLYLERFKFILRLILMVSYWKDSLEHQQQTGSPLPLLLGLVTDGGTYNIDQPTRGLTVEQEQALYKRRAYVGRRTGRRLVVKSKSTTTTPQQPSQSSAIRVVLAELLYTLRPLYWASAEATHFPAMDDDSRPSLSYMSFSLLKAWLVTLGMDLTSLGLLMKTDQVQVNNPATKAEWNRRRMKLFLYLLRSPVWSQLTAPTVETCSSVLRHIPLVGGLANSYLWDWILYQKHPYVSEAG